MRIVCIFAAIVFSFGLMPSAFADGEAEILSVEIKSFNMIHAHVRWTGSGSHQAGSRTTIQLHEADFGQEGLNRIQSLLTAALLRGKTVWIDEESASSSTVVGVHLLKSRR